MSPYNPANDIEKYDKYINNGQRINRVTLIFNDFLLLVSLILVIAMYSSMRKIMEMMIDALHWIINLV